MKSLNIMQKGCWVLSTCHKKQTSTKMSLFSVPLFTQKLQNYLKMKPTCILEIHCKSPMDQRVLTVKIKKSNW